MKKSKLIPIITLGATITAALPIAALSACSTSDESQEQKVNVSFDQENNSKWSKIDNLKMIKGQGLEFSVSVNNASNSTIKPIVGFVQGIVASNSSTSESMMLSAGKDFIETPIYYAVPSNSTSSSFVGVKVIIPAAIIEKLMEKKLKNWFLVTKLINKPVFNAVADNEWAEIVSYDKEISADRKAKIVARLTDKAILEGYKNCVATVIAETSKGNVTLPITAAYAEADKTWTFTLDKSSFANLTDRILGFVWTIQPTKAGQPGGFNEDVNIVLTGDFKDKFSIVDENNNPITKFKSNEGLKGYVKLDMSDLDTKFVNLNIREILADNTGTPTFIRELLYNMDFLGKNTHIEDGKFAFEVYPNAVLGNLSLNLNVREKGKIIKPQVRIQNRIISPEDTNFFFTSFGNARIFKGEDYTRLIVPRLIGRTLANLNLDNLAVKVYKNDQEVPADQYTAMRYGSLGFVFKLASSFTSLLNANDKIDIVASIV